MASFCTRYRNEHRRALAMLQRTSEDTELQQPYFSPQEDQDWNWSEPNSEDVKEWDGRFQCMVQVELELLEGNHGQSID